MLQRDIAKGVHWIEDAHTNWYLVEDGDSVTIVDTGLPASWRSLRGALGELGIPASAIKAVVLTHAHLDHIGFAERARVELDIPVFAHENEIPLIRRPYQYAHEASPLPYALQPKALGIAAGLLAKGLLWPKRVREVTRFKEGTLPVPGSPKVIATPGHTLGHCSFHLEDRDTLIAGDAILTLDPYTGRTGPRLPVRASTADSERALESLDAIEATGVKNLLTGHGRPWTKGAADAVALARDNGIS